MLNDENQPSIVTTAPVTNCDAKEQIVAGLTDLLKYKGITIKEKKIVQRALELWREENVEIVDCYLIACLEKDAQNILYSYDRDFDKFKIDRKAP